MSASLAALTADQLLLALEYYEVLTGMTTAQFLALEGEERTRVEKYYLPTCEHWRAIANELARRAARSAA